MIANVSPANSCTEHTLNTLRYADRVKEMKSETPHGGKKVSVSGEDQRDRELLLARQNNNRQRIKVKDNSLVRNTHLQNNTLFMKDQMMGGANSVSVERMH